MVRGLIASRGADVVESHPDFLPLTKQSYGVAVGNMDHKAGSGRGRNQEQGGAISMRQKTFFLYGFGIVPFIDDSFSGMNQKGGS